MATTALYPIPDGTYPLIFDGTIRWPALVNAGDTNVWLDEGWPLIRVAAKRRLFLHITRDQAQAAAMAAEELLCGFTVAATAEDTPRNQREVALLTSRLLSTCASAATTPTARAWYWAQAINLLDQLCEVGMPRLRPGPARGHIEKLLGADSLAGDRMGYLKVALKRLRHVVAAAAGNAMAEPVAPPIVPAPPSEGDAARSKAAVPLMPGA